MMVMVCLFLFFFLIQPSRTLKVTRDQRSACEHLGGLGVLPVPTDVKPHPLPGSTGVAEHGHSTGDKSPGTTTDTESSRARSV